jgi:hypothetical protein
MRMRKKILLAAIAIATTALAGWGKFRKEYSRCITQHKDALGRQIGDALIERLDESGATESIELPEYRVRDTWPMNYELHFWPGLTTPGAEEEKFPECVAYFIARPSYPEWLGRLGIAPRYEELLYLRRDLSVGWASRDKLSDVTLGWE